MIPQTKPFRLIVYFSLLFMFIYGFWYQVNNYSKKTIAKTEPIGGIILPHHELADELINRSIEKISGNNYEKIIIIGPNHTPENNFQILTSDKISGYPINEFAVTQLVNNIPLITIDQNTLEREHSVMVPMKYLKKYFPKSKFIPIIFPTAYNQENLEEIANYFAQISDDKTLFVLSVDFAHNKMVQEALNNNKETINIIKNFNYTDLYRLTDTHVDSPISAGIFLMVMQKIGATNFNLWENSHGAILTNNPILQGTSYVIGTFSEVK